MNKSVKKKWVAALKSGKYKQSVHALKTDDGYCCLGVLCDIYQKEKKKKFWTTDCVDAKFLGESKELPYQVQKWAGLKDGNPSVIMPDEDTTTLAYLNDHGFGFNEIAKIIERKF